MRQLAKALDDLGLVASRKQKSMVADTMPMLPRC